MPRATLLMRRVRKHLGSEFESLRAIELPACASIVELQVRRCCEGVIAYYSGAVRPRGGDAMEAAFPPLLALLRDLLRNFHRQFALLEERSREDFGTSGKITALQGPLSDLHAGHECVWLVQVGECCVVYKPRRLQTDAIVCDLVDWMLSELNLAYPKIDFRLRDEYGWMAFVEGRTRRKRGAWYMSLGAQLAVLTLLRSADHHPENVVTLEDGPVCVDCECTLAPSMTLEQDSNDLFTPRAVRLLDGLRLSARHASLARRGFVGALDVVRRNPGRVEKTIDDMSDERMRVVLRNTEYYWAPLSRSRHPAIHGLRGQRLRQCALRELLRHARV
jgi:hypothetical protein